MHSAVLFIIHRPASYRLLHLLLSISSALIWVIALLLLLSGRRFYSRLSSFRFTTDEWNNMPKLSVLVPACNEAGTIERAMESLFAMNYPNFEIVAVNDRSTDATGEILDRLALRDSRLKALHISLLPAGWLGKNHALHVAAQEAVGEWLLFTDADVVYAPDTLRKAVAYACRRKIDHLVLTPRCETFGFWERLFVNYFGLMFSYWTRLWEVTDPKSRAFVGIGAFNLVRASSYNSFGGHCALPMDVADDLKLGKMIKAHGFKTEILDGGDLFSVRWVVGLSGIIESLMKNSFAGFGFNPFVAVGGALTLLFTTFYPYIALSLPGGTTRMLGFAGLLGMLGGARAMRSLAGRSSIYGFFYPLAALLLTYIIFRSMMQTYKLNGVVWRGTHYPLEELRRGVV